VLSTSAKDVAQSAETQASISATQAATSASNAEGSASTATQASVLSTSAKDVAQSAETQASISATQAATSASNAEGSASTATQASLLSTAARDAAASSETQASISSTQAATSESNAAGSASTANTQAGLATSAKDLASGFSTAAGISAFNAATSETNAAGSASSAATSETNVKAIVRGTSLGLPLEQWVLNGQSIVTVSDGPVGINALRLVGAGGAYPNQGNYVPIDRTRNYRVRFWAKPSSDAAGLLYFSLQQFLDSSGTVGPVNGGRSPYKPSGQNRAQHLATYGDTWGLYNFVWTSADWQSGVKFVRPDFLDNYPGAAGYWDVQGFSFTDVTETEEVSAAVQTLASTTAGPNGTTAQYTVKTNAAGHVAGFGLSSTSNTSGVGTSVFGVTADRFFIAPSATASATAPTVDLYNGFTWVDTSVFPNVTRYWNGASWVTTPLAFPFIVQTTPITGTGTELNPQIPAGVYIDAAFIRNATITTAKIADLAVDNAKIGALAVDNGKIANLNANKITAGFISADRIEANSITAGKINSAGLTIYAADGTTVILNAGTSEFSGNVTGTVDGTSASTLVTTANDAATAAGAAQGTADDAATAASAAQGTADDAVDAAAAAQGTADDAATAASTAQGAADAAQDAADDALDVLADIASDNVLTPGEKPTIITDYGVITAEQAGIDAQATAYAITTQKTAYDNAVTALTTHLGTLTTPVAWNDLSGNTDIVGTTFRSKFTDVYTTRQALLNAISAAAKVLADDAATAASTAQGAADAAQTDADSALTSLTTKLNSNARNVLAGPGGLATGSLEWNSSGVRTEGSGIGITTKGIVAYNASNVATFVLNGDDGNATFVGTVTATSGSFTGTVTATSGSFTGAVSASTLSADSMDVAKRSIIEQASVTVPSSSISGTFIEPDAKGGGATVNYPVGTIFTKAINKLIRTNTTDAFFSTSSTLRQPFGCSVYATGTGFFIGGDGVFNIKVDAEIIVNRRYSAGGSSTVDENQVFIYLRQFVVTNVSSTFGSFTLPTTLYWKLSRA
jgi:hypothetical protein